MSKIKTFEEACEALKISTEVPQVWALPEKHQKAMLAHYKLVIIAEALNEGWKPDWSDWNKPKYFPWFQFDDSGSASGFSFGDYAYAGTYTAVGSRLCYATRELAEYAGKEFIDLYRDYMTFED